MGEADCNAIPLTRKIPLPGVSVECLSLFLAGWAYTTQGFQSYVSIFPTFLIPYNSSKLPHEYLLQ